MGFLSEVPKPVQKIGSALNATPGLVEDALQARVLRVLQRQFENVRACQNCVCSVFRKRMFLR